MATEQCYSEELVQDLRERLRLAEEGEGRAIEEVHRLRAIEVKYNNLRSLKARLIGKLTDFINNEPLP